jgi:methylmalonyl-CoA decarboxylase
MPAILTFLKDHIGTITLNRPERRNALDRALLDEITATMGELRHDGARVMVLRAQPGAEVWSSGYDISELPDPGVEPLTRYDALLESLQFMAHAFYPVVAMIEGSVWGGACDLAMSCDVLVGCPTTRFVPQPPKVLIPYGARGVMRWVDRLGPNVVKELFFANGALDADRSLRLGLLNHLVPAGQLEGFTYDLARRMAANSPRAVAAAKEEIRLLTAARPLGPEALERVQALRQEVYESGDYAEGVKAFWEKRSPAYGEAGAPREAAAVRPPAVTAPR